MSVGDGGVEEGFVVATVGAIEGLVDGSAVGLSVTLGVGISVRLKGKVGFSLARSVVGRGIQQIF